MHDRTHRMVNIDRKYDELLSQKFPGQASEIINNLLANHFVKEDEKESNLIGSNTNAGRLAYAQAMEKLKLIPSTAWKSLDSDMQLKFLSIYKKRLIELQARGF